METTQKGLDFLLVEYIKKKSESESATENGSAFADIEDTISFFKNNGVPASRLRGEISRLKAEGVIRESDGWLFYELPNK